MIRSLRHDICPGFDVGPPGLTKMDVHVKYLMASLFDIYIDIGDNVAEEQDRRSLIIAKNATIVPFKKIIVVHCFCSGI